MKSFLITIFLFCLIGCGVKGKPLAPLEPEVMGHGLPEYRGSKEIDEKEKTPPTDEDSEAKKDGSR